MKKKAANESQFTCPYCGARYVYNQNMICPKCGVLLYEYFALMNWKKQNDNQQVKEPFPIYQPFFLKPTQCKIKNLKNNQNKKLQIRLCDISYVAISYNILTILGKRDDNYDTDSVLADFLLAVTAGPNDYQFVVGFRQHQIRNISYYKYIFSTWLVIETAEGYFLEIKGNKDLYNTIETWWRGYFIQHYTMT